MVIGSGPAGQRAAIASAKSYRRTLMIEKRSVVGGTCINTGTIPSKAFRESAEVSDDLPATESAVAAEERVAAEQESAAVLAGVASVVNTGENGKVR